MSYMSPCWRPSRIWNYPAIAPTQLDIVTKWWLRLNHFYSKSDNSFSSQKNVFVKMIYFRSFLLICYIWINHSVKVYINKVSFRKSCISVIDMSPILGAYLKVEMLRWLFLWTNKLTELLSPQSRSSFCFWHYDTGTSKRENEEHPSDITDQSQLHSDQYRHWLGNLNLSFCHWCYPNS